MNASPNTETSSEAATEKDPRWAAVVARDGAADGKFYYSVKTTGVYCRPSCASRLAKPENVQFHATCADAEQAGFRPCKRCKPDQPSLVQRHAAKVAEMCRLIEGAQETLTLSELSRKAGMSVFHLHRIFKAATGLTPRAYAAAHRAKRIRNQLGRSNTVTEAIFDAGFNSTGRFYETSDQLLGMTPTDYRAGGAHIDIRFAVSECSLGSILVAQSERGICAIFLGDDPNVVVRDLQDKFTRANLIAGDEGFEQLVARVVGLVEAPALGLDLPLDVRGTAFQQSLAGTPRNSSWFYHKLRGYCETDRVTEFGAGRGTSLRSERTGSSNTRNDGALSGYRWGVERKRERPRHER